MSVNRIAARMCSRSLGLMGRRVDLGPIARESAVRLLGPEAGEQRSAARIQVPVVYDGDRVAELVADGCSDAPLLERVAATHKDQLVRAQAQAARESLFKVE